MSEDSKHLEITLETQVESVNLAEEMCLRVAEAAGFGEGKGFDLGGVPNPLAEENLLSTSGRGIFLMRAFMDEFEVVPGRTGGAEIIMAKKLPLSGNPGTNGKSQNATPNKES